MAKVEGIFITHFYARTFIIASPLPHLPLVSYSIVRSPSFFSLSASPSSFTPPSFPIYRIKLLADQKKMG
jgi:hypothetical protein